MQVGMGSCATRICNFIYLIANPCFEAVVEWLHFRHSACAHLAVEYKIEILVVGILDMSKIIL